MKTFVSTLLLISLFYASAAHAQNSDLAVLAGISGPQGKATVTGSMAISTGSVSPSVQLNYAWQILQRKADLYVELPLVIPIRVSGSSVVGLNGVQSTTVSGPDIFFTPGARLKFSPQARTSFYGAAGFGYASFAPTSSFTTSPLSLNSGTRQSSPALDFGGGIDFRLTRLLSFRADARDFITQADMGGISGRNHGIFQAGIAFHF
jgi:hypothetical protein